MYKGYYPESPDVQCSPIRPRVDTRPDRPDLFVTQRPGEAESKPVRTTSTPALQHEMMSRQEQSTLDTIQDTVKTAVDSLVEALSRQPTSCGYKLPAIQVPKYKSGVDWRLFKADFRQTMSMADLKPSLQMAHLRQAVPEEAKKLLYQEQIDTVDRAFEVLMELFEPHKDSSTLMEEILKRSISTLRSDYEPWQDELRTLQGGMQKLCVCLLQSWNNSSSPGSNTRLLTQRLITTCYGTIET